MEERSLALLATSAGCSPALATPAQRGAAKSGQTSESGGSAEGRWKMCASQDEQFRNLGLGVLAPVVHLEQQVPLLGRGISISRPHRS